MAYFTRKDIYDMEDYVLRDSAGQERSNAANLSSDYIGSNPKGKKIIRPGTFIAECFDVNGEVIDRAWPASYVNTAITTADTELDLDTPFVFVPGDVLYVIEPYTTLTVASTALGSITYQGRTYSYTPVGAASAGEAAVMFASYFANTPLHQEFKFVPDETNAELHVLAADGASQLTITLAGSLGTGNVTTTVVTTAVGTVLAFNSTTNKVLLSAVSGVDVPAGLGVGVNINSIKGLHADPTVLDLTENSDMQVGILTAGNVKASKLKYWNTSVSKYFPKLLIY